MIPRLDQLEAVDRAHRELLDALREGGFSGDIRPDLATRLVSATDNSVYQILPQGVVYPRTTADVSLALRLLAEERFRQVSLSPRGGGTGTNGQSLNDGIVLDVSRHMSSILEIDVERRVARVQPGVVLDQLNAALEPHGLMFGPSLSPSSRATIGGMIGTDACGIGSRIYGRTSQHVLELEVVLSDGAVWRAGPLDPIQLEAAGAEPGRIGEIHRVVDAVLTEKADLIAEAFPKLLRFMTGYNLARLRLEDRLDLTNLIAGAEGTLGVVTEAALNLVPIPAHRRLVVLKYAAFEDALASAEELLQTDPGAIETIDETILGLARQDVIWHAVGPLLGDDPSVRCVNLVEYEGQDRGEVERKAAALREHGRSVGAVFAEPGAETAALWALRKKGVGLLGNAPGPRTPVAFVEDTVVPPERLRDYVRELRAILDEHGLRYAMYGHIDVGCLHVRPALNLVDPEDERLIRRISDRVVALVQRYGGVVWGEHGKGMRSEYNPVFFGEELYGALCRIKAAFDPHGQLNPGKVAVPAGSDAGLASVEAPTRGALDRQIAPAAGRRFDRALACNGNGACFHWDPDHVMCPSSRVTRDRVHSPKGRAGLLREWLRQLSAFGVDAAAALSARPGRFAWLERRRRRDYDFSHEVYDAMDGCYACKACGTQCPIHVDVPELRSDFLELYHRRYRRPVRDHLVAALEGMLPWMARMPRLANAASGRGPGRWLLERAIGIVDTPRLSVPTARRGLRERGVAAFDPAAAHDAQTVLLLPDAFTTFFEAPVLLAAVDLLTAVGLQVRMLPYMPSGKALHIKGFRHRFEREARAWAARLEGWASHGLPIVGVDPAVTLFFREEVHSVAGGTGARVQLLQELLADRELEPIGSEEPFLLFGHCTERTSVPAAQALWQRVFSKLGVRLEVEPVGCCGMCGVFGHESHHLEESRRAFELSWKRRLPTGEDARHRVLATGHSCRAQVERFGGFRPRHPVEALAQLHRKRTPRPERA